MTLYGKLKLYERDVGELYVEQQGWDGHTSSGSLVVKISASHAEDPDSNSGRSSEHLFLLPHVPLDSLD